MLRSSGLLLAFATVLLQISVFLQPLLPEQYQIAPVCEKLTHDLLHSHDDHDEHSIEHQSSFIHHYLHFDSIASDPTGHTDHHHNKHNFSHQCQYCVVYGNLVLPPDVGLKEIFVRLQVRLLAFNAGFQHIYFALQRLYLLPQGRAPPIISM